MTHPWRPRRVAVLGASGLTGAGIAHQLSLTDEYDEIVLFDLARNVLEAHAIDMREAQIAQGRTRARLVVSSLDRVAETAPVDLVVVAAALPETPDGTRAAFLAGNLGVLRALTPAITTLAGGTGLVMIVTNPADILASCLAQISDIEPGRIFGYCLNDSIRFTAAVARELAVSPERIEALVVGEHGDGQVLVWSGLRLDGKPLALTDDQRARIDADARGWFRRWSDLRAGRSSGWTTPLGSARTIAALIAGSPVPVAVWFGDSDAARSHTTLRAVVQDGRVVATPLTYLDDAERTVMEETSAAIAMKTREALAAPTGCAAA